MKETRGETGPASGRKAGASNPTRSFSLISLARVRISLLRSHHNSSRKRNQRKHEKDRPATAVDYAMNHLRAYIHAEEADHEDAEAIPQNAERNDECDKYNPPPWRLQEQIARPGYWSSKEPSSIECHCIPAQLRW